MSIRSKRPVRGTFDAERTPESLLVPPPPPPVKGVDEKNKPDVDAESILTKRKLEGEWHIPTAKQVCEQRHQQFESEKAKFLTDVMHNFESGLNQGTRSFVICYNLQYTWQNSILEDQFYPKGYEITYKNVKDYHEDRTCVELNIPGCINTREPFQM